MRSVYVFLVVTFVLTWPISFLAFGWNTEPDQLLTRDLLACLAMLMPAVSAFIVRRWVEKTGFADAGWRSVSWTWYAAAFGVLFAFWALPEILTYFLSGGQVRTQLSSGEQIVIVNALLLSIIPGFGEEFGWRGYLLPRMIRNTSLGVIPILCWIGVIWGIWHWPIVLGPLLRTGMAEGFSSAPFVGRIGQCILMCLVMTAFSILLSVVMGALWLRTRSMIFLAFVHGYYDAIRDVRSIILDTPTSGIVALVRLGGPIIAFLIAYRWLRRREHQGSWEDLRLLKPA